MWLLHYKPVKFTPYSILYEYYLTQKICWCQPDSHSIYIHIWLCTGLLDCWTFEQVIGRHLHQLANYIVRRRKGSRVGTGLVNHTSHHNYYVRIGMDYVQCSIENRKAFLDQYLSIVSNLTLMSLSLIKHD